MNRDWVRVRCHPDGYHPERFRERWVDLGSVVDVTLAHRVNDLWKITGVTAAGEPFELGSSSLERCHEFMRAVGIPLDPPVVGSAGE